MSYFTKHRIFLIFILIIFLFIPHFVKSTTWYDNFGYRKRIAIHNPNGTTLTNYQIKLTLHSGTGIDTGSDIYLNNNVQANFNDIRFTQDDELTLLNYWVESINAGTATVWVKVNLLAASADTNIFLYYSNSGATSQSNGTSTFSFFDDFDENGINGWVGSEELVDHVEETGNQHQLVNTSTYVSSPQSAQLQTYASCFSGPFDGVRSLITASPNLSAGNYSVDFDVKLQITGFRYTTGGVQRARVRVNDVEKYYDEIGCSGMNCTADGSWATKSFALSNASITSIALIADSYDCINGNTFYDNVRVRQYVSNEPTVAGVNSFNTIPQQSSNTQSPSNPIPETCSDIVLPAPDLFQINTTQTNAKIYFTPLGDSNQYFISYSTDQNAEEYGALVDLGVDGVQSYTIDMLKPRTTYYFKVRGQKGCMPGNWSGIKQARTKSTVVKRNTLPTPQPTKKAHN